MAGFIFGGETGVQSAAELARRRKLVDALLDTGDVMPRTFGEGLTVFGRAIAGKLQDKKLSAKEEAERVRAMAEFNGIPGVSGGGSGSGGGGGDYGSPWVPKEKTPLPAADPGMIGGGRAGIGFAGAAPADPGMIGATGGLALPGQSGGTAEEIFQAELMAAGLPEHVVHGIMMNGKDESNFDPNAVGDNGAALGILQWNGPRKRALEAFASSVGGSPTDPKIQAQFTLAELGGSEKAALDAMMATKSAGEAGAAFVNQFERPAEEHRARREAAYLGGTGGGPVTMSASSGTDPAAGLDLAKLAELASNPYLPEGQRAIVSALLTQAMTPTDPMDALALEKARLEIEAMKNPGADPMAAIELEQAQLNLDQDRAGAGADAATYGTTLQFFTDPNTGKTRAGVLGSDGTLKEIAPPDGGDWATGIEKVDAGTKWLIYDKRTGQKIGEEIKDVRGEESEKAIGKIEGEATGALPGATGMAALIDQQINDLKNDPYLPNMLGPIDSRMPNVSEDAARVQGRIDQLQGGAFLQARQMLKGGGAITDFEGQKAEAAFVRMNAAQSVEDFTAALDEFNSAVQDGIKKLEAQAGSGGAAPAASGAPVAITSDAEYDALPPGTMFVGPDGKTRRKP
jgi:hypothetical protein